MNRVFSACAAMAMGLLLAAPAASRADIIFESAKPIVTSTSNTGVVNISGTEVDSTFYSGINFYLTSTTTITAIGGHFSQPVSVGNQMIFGAIVSVNNLSAAPSDPTLATGVLGKTLISLPSASGVGTPVVTNTVSGTLNLTLGAGYYALIFGSGLFGATGKTLAVTSVNNVAVNSDGLTTYTLRQPDGHSFAQAGGARFFVVSGTAVPEPSSLAMATAGLLVVGLGARAHRRSRRETA